MRDLSARGLRKNKQRKAIDAEKPCPRIHMNPIDFMVDDSVCPPLNKAFVLAEKAEDLGDVG